MFLTKLRLAVGVGLVAMALGAGGLVYQAGGGPGAAQAVGPEGKPPTELEALRKENELLKVNLQVVLEKVRAQEAELRAFRDQKQAAAGGQKGFALSLDTGVPVTLDAGVPVARFSLGTRPDPLQDAEAALKALREARDPKAKRQAADALEKALKELREQLK